MDWTSLKRALQRNSLWIMSVGLMAASSGVDGAYMATWMPPRAWWLGYVLNTTSDVASEVLMYWFGRLQQERKRTKKRRYSWWLLPATAASIAFSWFFSWRQLLRVMPAVEHSDARWVAPVSAAFVPLMLASVGYAQALLAGKFDDATQGGEGSDAPSNESEAEATLACPYCGATEGKTGKPFASPQAVSAHLASCEAYKDGRGGDGED